MSSMDKYQEAADVMTAAGFDAFGQDPAPIAVMAALDRLGEFLAGAEPMIKEVCIAAACSQIRLSGFATSGQAEKMVKAAIKQTLVKGDDDTCQTFGEAPNGEILIDIVQDKRELQWVIARPPGTRAAFQQPVEVVSTVDGRVMWPRPCLPWKGIPRARDVERAWSTGPDGRELFLELTDVFRRPPPKRLMILPEPQGTWAAALALWVMGTYVQHWFKYYSVLLLEGPPERGKSRLGNAVVFLARRGMATMSPTEAVIFRNRSRHMVSLFLDVRDLPGLMEKRQGIEELILAGMERGKVVQRVLRPDAPTPIGEMKGFETYGPLLLASNRDVPADHPLASRCLRIPMPEAGSQDVAAALNADDERVLVLRAKLVAWAARVIAEGTEAPGMPRLLTGRLHDIASPLLQMARLVFPEGLSALVDLLKATEHTRRVDTSESWEGRVAKALIELRTEAQWPSLLGVGTVTDRVNAHVAEKEQLTPHRVGRIARGLTIASERHGGYRYLVYPGDDFMRELAARYGFETKS